MEMLSNALNGWQAFTTPGKLCAGFVIAILFLWQREKEKSDRRAFLLYSTVIGIFCILPPTAVLVMIYQTKFYDYQWVWSFVPVTAIIALALVNYFLDYIPYIGFEKSENEDQKRTKDDVKRDRRFARFIKVVAVLVVLCGLPLMGRIGEKSTYETLAISETDTERTQAYEILNQIEDITKRTEVYLWAPQDIISYARESGNNVKLLYGRNMWDKALNAFAYDTYTEEVQAMYAWMEQEEGYDTEQSKADLLINLKKADRLGVDCILIPMEKIQSMQLLTGSSTGGRLPVQFENATRSQKDAWIKVLLGDHWKISEKIEGYCLLWKN